jgi:hypothetical protein
MERSKPGLLLAKIESTYGTDPTPTAGSNVIGAWRGTVNLDISADSIQRAILDPGYNRVIGYQSMKQCAISFRTEVRGNRTGAASNDIAKGSSTYAIEIDSLLKSCDLTPTYVAESSGGARDGFVFYRPALPSTEFGSSVTFYLYSEGKLYKATGCKGDVSAVMEAGKLCFFDWKFSGFYNVPTDNTPIPTGTFLTTAPPLLETPSNVLSAVSVTASSSSGLLITYNSHGLFNGDRVKFGGTAVPGNLTAGTYYYLRDVTANTFKLAATLNGTAIAYSSAGTAVTMTSLRSLLTGTLITPVFQTFNFKLGNVVSMRPDGNSSNGIKGWCITDRASSVDVDTESELEATDPRWADWAAPTLRNVRLNLGTASGNRFAIDCTTQLTKLTYGERNGIRTQSQQLDIVNANVGDTPGAELALIFQ